MKLQDVDHHRGDLGKENRQIFEDCRKAEVAELWDKVIVWSSLWSSVSNGFRDVNLSAIL